MHSDIAGVVLAGGRSSRMEQNKALLKHKGKTFLENAIQSLKQSNIKNIYVSGNYKNHNCIKDQKDFEGPAIAMHDIIKSLPYSKFLFLAVDMPLITSNVISYLLKYQNGAFFEDNYLPVFINTQHKKLQKTIKVRDFLAQFNLNVLKTPQEFQKNIININTKTQLQEYIQDEYKA